MQAIAESCYETQQEHGRFLSTAFTARDMMKIVDALGEDGKLRFWGISYGTILGQVAAAMFPDRIGRLLLDSNSLADAYLTSTGVGGPHDTEKSLVHLFAECVELGTKYCKVANYSGSSTTVEDLRDATVETFQKLKDLKTLPDGLSSKDYPYAGNSILKQLKYGIMNLLSSPFNYPSVVEILSYAFEGDYKKALSVYKEDTSEWNLGTNAFQGIACSESSFRVSNPEDLYSMYQAHLAGSSFGDAIAADYVACAAWKFDAAEGVDTNTLRNVNTSFPVLVVNNANDPITSLNHAWQVSSRFRESRLLINEGVGVSMLPSFWQDFKLTCYSMESHRMLPTVLLRLLLLTLLTALFQMLVRGASPTCQLSRSLSPTHKMVGLVLLQKTVKMRIWL